MNETEFATKYRKDIPIYQAWGDYVNNVIIKSLISKRGGKKELDLFLKIPPLPRVKDVNSIISKAYYRKKKYADPYDEITDKVGVRYVVLLRDDLEIVRHSIENADKWTFSKNRDFEEESLANPTTFDYQSIHYVVKNKKEFSTKNTLIPGATPCEIQIRTLLQHAYSELTHDIVYKPKTQASPSVVRSVSKSMALMEVTDEIFGQVTMAIKSFQNRSSDFLLNLQELYNGIVAADYEEKLNAFILDAFKELIDDETFSEIRNIASEETIKAIIKRKYKSALLYRQPVILLIYYLILEKRTLCKQLWPFTENELQPLFSDLGIAFEGAY